MKRLLYRGMFAFAKRVKVEFCPSWSFRGDFNYLKREIGILDPQIQVVGTQTPTSTITFYVETGKFEVVLEEDGKPDKELWSKIKGDSRINQSNIERILKNLKNNWVDW